MAVCRLPASADVSQNEAKQWKPNIGRGAGSIAEPRAGDVGFAVFDMRGRLEPLTAAAGAP